MWHELFEWKTATTLKVLKHAYRVTTCMHVGQHCCSHFPSVNLHSIYNTLSRSIFFLQIYSAVNFILDFHLVYFFILFSVRWQRTRRKKLNLKIFQVNDSRDIHRLGLWYATPHIRTDTRTRADLKSQPKHLAILTNFMLQQRCVFMIHANLMGVNYISDFMLLKILLGAFALDNGIWSTSSVSPGAGFF